MCSQDALPLWKMTTKYEIPQHYIIAGKIFRMLGVKKTISDWYYPPSSYFVSKMIYMYKVFLSLLNHLFESSSLVIYIPHWRQTFLTARENFIMKKHCYEIIPNFRYTVIPWKVSEAESILIWVMISLCFWFTQLHFQKICIILSPNQKKS